MAIQQRFCVNHPDRPAIGICVITQKAICGECSTRYEGVNYSREGLQILQQRRAKAAQAGPRHGWALLAASILATPLLLYLMYLCLTISADWLMTYIFNAS